MEELVQPNLTDTRSSRFVGTDDQRSGGQEVVELKHIDDAVM